MSILKALSARTPVVTTLCGSITDELQHAENAMLAPIQKPEQLAKHIIDICCTPSLRNTLTENGFLFASNHSIQKMASQTCEIYQSLKKY